MANTLLTLKEIARRALPRLTANLVFPNLIYRDFSNDYHDMGDTVRVRRPTVFTAQEFDEEEGVQYADLTEDAVDVTLDHIATVDARAGAIETATNLAELDRVFIEPAAAALAEKINADGLKLYRDVSASCGTAGVTPATLKDIGDVRLALNLGRVPSAGRVAVWDPQADAALAQLPAIVNAEKSGSVKALREGSMGRVFGLNNYMSQAVCRHENGATAFDGVTLAAPTLAGDTVLSLKGKTLTGRLTHGDLLNVGGRTYAVAADSDPAEQGAVQVRVCAPLPELSAGTAVTLVDAHTANLAFHPMAFAYVSRPLLDPDGQGVSSYVTRYNGISLRVTKGYDQRFKRSTYSMDVLYGYKAVYPELAVRVLG